MELFLIKKVAEMQISGKKIPVESQFMTDFWALRKKFYIPEERDSYWISLMDETDELYKKYGQNEYVKKMLFALIDDLEKRHRKIYQSMDGSGI